MIKNNDKTAHLRSLINRPAQINEPVTPNGDTKLMIAVELEDLNLIKELISNGAEVNIKDKNSYTAVHYAVCNNGKNGVKILKFLAKHGVELNVKNNWGVTPVHMAVAYDNIKALKYLVKHGLDVNSKDDNNETPLHAAALRNDPEVFQYLIKNGAELNAKDNGGDTPLMVAGLCNTARACDLILAGADYTTRNRFNRTIFTQARDIGKKDMPNAFLKAIQQRQEIEVKSLIKSSVEEQIEKLKSDKLLRSLVLKLTVLGKLINTLTYEESKKLYSSVLIKMPVKKKIAIRHQIHAKRMENCL